MGFADFFLWESAVWVTATENHKQKHGNGIGFTDFLGGKMSASHRKCTQSLAKQSRK